MFLLYKSIDFLGHLIPFQGNSENINRPRPDTCAQIRIASSRSSPCEISIVLVRFEFFGATIAAIKQELRRLEWRFDLRVQTPISKISSSKFNLLLTPQKHLLTGCVVPPKPRYRCEAIPTRSLYWITCVVCLFCILIDCESFILREQKRQAVSFLNSKATTLVPSVAQVRSWQACRSAAREGGPPEWPGSPP